LADSPTSSMCSWIRSIASCSISLSCFFMYPVFSSASPSCLRSHHGVGHQPHHIVVRHIVMEHRARTSVFSRSTCLSRAGPLCASHGRFRFLPPCAPSTRLSLFRSCCLFSALAMLASATLAAACS
jgi:hypothetical protein